MKTFLLYTNYNVTVSWYLINVEQTVRNKNSISWSWQSSQLKMIGMILVSALDISG